jgi:hypothetical protein
MNDDLNFDEVDDEFEEVREPRFKVRRKDKMKLEEAKRTYNCASIFIVY